MALEKKSMLNPVAQSYDVIVLGVGSMGSAACYHLASRGFKVLGIEQFDIPHDQGSHAGQSRIIRKAYFEHPDYVPLLERAYQNWKSLEEETGAKIYTRTGLFYLGKPDSAIIKGVKEASKLYHVPVEELTPAQSVTRFPQFVVPAGFQSLYEPEAGFVTPERAILAFTEAAMAKGAVIKTKERIQGWKSNKDGIEVTTSSGTFKAGKIIITAGAWTSKLIKLPTTLKVTRQTVAWLKPKDPARFALGHFPCWIHEDPAKGSFYGFPVLPTAQYGGPIGLKLAHHYPQAEVDPDQVNRDIPPAHIDELKVFLKTYMPEAEGEPFSVKSCLYTYSKDENFIIDHLPGYDGAVTFACGFSGHGFKFASVVGEILADLALNGQTSLPAGFLGLKRFSS